MKVKLKKAFTHHGKAYQVGDEFEGLQEEIAVLARQGYCDVPQTAETSEGADEKPIGESHSKAKEPPPLEPKKPTKYSR